MKYTKNRGLIKKLDGTKYAYRLINVYTNEYEEFAEGTPEFEEIKGEAIEEAQLKIESYIIEDEKALELPEKYKKLKKKAIAAISVGGILAILGIGGCAVATNSLNKKAEATTSSTSTSIELEENTNDNPEDTKDTPDNSTEAFDEKIDLNNTEEKVEEAKIDVNALTTEEIKSPEKEEEKSRYTTITVESLGQATEDTMIEFKKHGVELDAADVLTATSISNITHISETNQELLSQAFAINGDGDEETKMSKLGHIIGQVMTLEASAKDEEVDWSVLFIDETDKKIAKYAMETIRMAKEIANSNEISEQDKATQIQNLVQERFVKPNFDKTVGYEINGTREIIFQEDGASFVTDAIVTGFFLTDTKVADYIDQSETMQDLLVIAKNKDNVSNIQTIMRNCQPKTIK